jgi:predicted transposase YdaD
LYNTIAILGIPNSLTCYAAAMDDLQDFKDCPELKADLVAIIAKGPSLRGRLETGEQLKELQQRFAESAAARGVDFEQVSQNAFEEIHPGHARRD